MVDMVMQFMMDAIHGRLLCELLFLLPACDTSRGGGGMIHTGGLAKRGGQIGGPDGRWRLILYCMFTAFIKSVGFQGRGTN